MQLENIRKKNYNRTLGNFDTRPLQEKELFVRIYE